MSNLNILAVLKACSHDAICIDNLQHTTDFVSSQGSI